MDGHSTYALPTKITSPPPNQDEDEHIAYSQYDFSTGLLTGFKDRNGVITETIYNAPFDHPTLINSGLCPGCGNLQTHTAMYYAEAPVPPPPSYGVSLSNNDVPVAKDQTDPNDGNLRSWTKTDGFGRTTQSWSEDPQVMCRWRPPTMAWAVSSG